MILSKTGRFFIRVKSDSVTRESCRIVIALPNFWMRIPKSHVLFCLTRQRRIHFHKRIYFWRDSVEPCLTVMLHSVAHYCIQAACKLAEVTFRTASGQAVLKASIDADRDGLFNQPDQNVEGFVGAEIFRGTTIWSANIWKRVCENRFHFFVEDSLGWQLQSYK